MGTEKRARQKANRAKKIAEVQKVEKRDQRKQYVIVIALLVVLAAIVICFLATIYPSRQAAKLDPAQALRYE